MSSEGYPDWLATGRASSHQKLALVTPFLRGHRLIQVNLERGRKTVCACVCEAMWNWNCLFITVSHSSIVKMA